MTATYARPLPVHLPVRRVARQGESRMGFGPIIAAAAVSLVGTVVFVLVTGISPLLGIVIYGLLGALLAFLFGIVAVIRDQREDRPHSSRLRGPEISTHITRF